MLKLHHRKINIRRRIAKVGRAARAIGKCQANLLVTRIRKLGNGICSYIAAAFADISFIALHIRQGASRAC